MHAILISVACGVIISSAIATDDIKPPIIITRADEDAITKLLADFHKHIQNPVISSRSDLKPYLDCAAHRELLKYEWKAVPYLIQQAGLQQEVDADLGAALINDKQITTSEQVLAYNRERRKKVGEATLPGFVLATVLRETQAGKEAAKVGKLERIAGTRIVGIRHSDSFAWLEWWQANKDRFAFQTGKPIAIAPPENGVYHWPHVTTKAHGNLLDIHAVSATYRDIIERAAAELELDIFIGKHDYLDVLSTVRMKSVTFDEFLFLAGHGAGVQGFSYRKIGNKYHIGGDEPAKPRANLNGWGIMMPRTVFSVGDQIPVTIVTRGTSPLVDPADPSFPDYGSFQVTRNDGSIVTDYRPLAATMGTLPMVKPGKDAYAIEVALGRFCKLAAGEYNIRFRYKDHETPTVAIEIYDRGAKK